MLNITRYLRPFKKYSLVDLEKKFRGPRVPSEVIDARPYVRAAVIDDQKFYPLENLMDSDYDIVYIGNISKVRYVKNYDIIVCDIQGVGRNINSELQGGALISQIREAYPEKYIIVYSGNFSDEPRVRMALEKSNANIIKGATLDEWTRALDIAIAQVSNPVSRWRAMRTQLEDLSVPQVEIGILEDAYVRSVVYSDRSILERSVRGQSSIGADARAIVQGLISSAIWAIIAG